MTQVFLQAHHIWADVIAESDVFLVAKDVDGVMTYVVKDGYQQVRMKL